MSSRASYVVIDRGVVGIHYDKWGARDIARELFTGPAAAVARFLARERSGTLETDVWCEGGAVVDIDRRSLLFFGSQEHLGEPPVQRAVVEVIAGRWPEWRVRWAFEGVADFAQALALPVSSVVAPLGKRANGVPAWACPTATLAVVVSVAQHRRTHLSALHPWFRELVECGPDAIVGAATAAEDVRHMSWARGRGGPSRSTFESASRTYAANGFPSGGLHFDVAERRLRYWTRWPSTFRHAAAQAREWVGWRVECLNDRFEEHVALCHGRLSIESQAHDEALREALGHVE